MGLVVQATQDPLLTLLAPIVPAAQATAAPDVFEALLTELLGAHGAETIVGAAPKDAAPAKSRLPGELPAAGDPTKDETKSATLLEALAQLQPAQVGPVAAKTAPEKQAATSSTIASAGGKPLTGGVEAGLADAMDGANAPATPTAGASLDAPAPGPANTTITSSDAAATPVPATVQPNGATAAPGVASTTVTNSGGAATPAPATLPPTDATAAPGPASTTVTNADGAATPAPTTFPPADATSAPAPKEHSDSSGKTVLPPGMFRAAFRGRADHAEHPNRGGKAPAGDVPPETPVASAPPGDAPPVTQQAAISVVRSVGNANDNAATNSGENGKDPGQPQPKASAEGIAHSSEHSILHRADETQQAPETAAPKPAPQAQLPEAARQVIRAVVERAEQGGGEARLHLRPENLGEVTIRVQTDGDHVRVEIRADRPEAAQLLREHSVELSNMLGNQGLNLGNLSVGLGGQQAGGSQNEQPQSAAPNRPGSSEFGALMGLGETDATDRHNLLRAAYNPDGTHVYRV